MQHPLNPAGWRVPSWDPALELTSCMFYEPLILGISRQSFQLHACVCLCVLGVLVHCHSHHCKRIFFWPAQLTVMRHRAIKLFPSVYLWRCLLLQPADKFSTQAPAGRCALPDPVMKAFRCLETCHFPQLCVPGLHSDEACLYHSQAYRQTFLISASRYKFQILSLCRFRNTSAYNNNWPFGPQKETLSFQLFL